MIKTYSFLLIAIFCEVAGTMLLPVSQNFTKIIPTICLTLFYLVSFYLMTFVMNKLPIAIVYATWSGLGVFTIAILGYFFFKQTLAWQAIAGLFLIVIGVILVNSFAGKILRGTIRKIADKVEYKIPPTIDDPAILDEIKQDLIENKILNNG